MTWCVAVTRSTLPSGRDCATNSDPIVPDAPARFSTIVVTPSFWPRYWAMNRARISVVPPGGNGTTILIVCTGNSSACAVTARPQHPISSHDNTIAASALISDLPLSIYCSLRRGSSERKLDHCLAGRDLLVVLIFHEHVDQ